MFFCKCYVLCFPLLIILTVELNNPFFLVQFTLAYYLMQDVLKWDIHKYSNFNAAQFAVEGITLLAGMPVFLYKWKIGDHLIAALGIMSKMVGYAVFGLSNTDVLAYSCK